MSEIIVGGSGPTPCKYMIVGERPGAEEAFSGLPFQGRSGEEQDLFLSLLGMVRAQFYITNLVKDYADGNPDPTSADIHRWTPVLLDELSRVRPDFVLAVGRYATRWFLGNVDMDSVHGTPRRSVRASATVIPCYHPAFGLYDPDAKGLVYSDYKAAVEILKGRRSAVPVEDEIAHPAYHDIEDPRRLKVELDSAAEPIVALDTEGVPGAEWSFQISTNPGTGLVVRSGGPMFAVCRAVFQDWLQRADPLIIVHNTMYDLPMMRGLGCDIARMRLYDTMIAAYLLRLEPQALKHLARRHCGMEMLEYREMIGDAADAKRETFLWSVLDRDWDPPEPRLIVENDLTTRLYKPQPIAQLVEKLLVDWSTAKDNLAEHGRFVVKLDAKDDFSVQRRWAGIDEVQRGLVEAQLGPLPDATLADVSRERAIRYSGRDPDATLRVYRRIAPMVTAAGLDERMSLIMENLPSIEEMQSTGMLCDRADFEALNARMNAEMESLCARLSNQFNDGRPINPNSPVQVAELMQRRGLVGLKKSKKTRKVSTSKKSIEHLRHEDPAIAIVEDWRERGKTRDSFGVPILERIPAGLSRSPVRCNIRVSRVASSRLAATDPPWLAIPVRHELGVAVRSCIKAPSAQDLLDHYDHPIESVGDCFLGTWDLSQIEMRVMAHLSRDPLLCQLFREGRDIHAETAIRIFGLNIKGEQDENGKWIYPGVKKKTQRDPTKRAGFGVITGIQGQGLLDQLRMMGCEGWTEDTCDELIESWFGVYKGVADFLSACKSQCRDRGFVRDMGGMYRYLPGIWSRDDKVSAEAGRQSHSHIIQGSAQWMIQRAMAWLKPQINDLRDSTGWFVRWLLQIHDELLFAYDQRVQDIMHQLVLEALTEHSYKLIVPVEANGAYGLTWGALEK